KCCSPHQHCMRPRSCVPVAKKSSAKTSTKEPGFEACLKELDEIVSKLESGKLGLAESLEHYEKGVQHLQDCYKLLHDAERRIELVSQLDSTGRAITEPFD